MSTRVRWGQSGTLRIVAGAESTDGAFSVVEGELELTCGDEAFLRIVRKHDLELLEALGH